MSLVALRSVVAGYGGALILHGVDIAIDHSDIGVIVGPNGAGKSTAMKAIFGMLNVRSGSVRLAGEDITALSPQDRVVKGMGFVPQVRNIFPSMTVEENLEMGAYTVKDPQKVEENLQWVYGLFPKLEERQRQMAGTFSGGEQQMLTIGRALMSRPRFLMLDEPSLGLQPNIVSNVFKSLEVLHGEGVTILLVEQNVRKSLEIAQRAYVLEHGHIVMTGESKELLQDEGVKKAYLGI